MFTSEPKGSISHALLRIGFVTGFILIAAFGCDSNTAQMPESSAQSPAGSFAPNNPADCLPAIDLIDQHRTKVSLATLKGKPVLIDFIYADCATACPLLTSRFAQIAGKLGGALGTKVTMVSITIDPEHDHPAQLLDYTKTHHADREGWLMLTGAPADIETVLHIYRLNRERGPDGTIAHVTTSFLVGADGRQIRMYNTMEVSPDTVVNDIDGSFLRGRPNG